MDHLGGRLIWLKSVLENTHVYWLSLAKVPSSIHNLTRQKLISFLWIASRAKEGVHLARWDTISIPMKFGSWDIKNILWLGKALAMKSLWRSLMGKALWSEIILDKYLKNKPLREWIRKVNKKWHTTSNIWSGLTATYPDLGSRLTWRVGNGLQAKLRVDPFISGEGVFKMSTNVIQELLNRGLHYLYQVERQDPRLDGSQYWFSVEELILWTVYDVEWDHHIKSLNHCGIRFPGAEDELVWSWNQSTT